MKTRVCLKYFVNDCMISKSRALRTNFGNLNDNFDWKIDGDQMKKNA